jgi:hypothetical protein
MAFSEPLDLPADGIVLPVKMEPQNRPAGGSEDILIGFSG